MENYLWRDEKIIICWNISIVFARYNLALVSNAFTLFKLVLSIYYNFNFLQYLKKTNFTIILLLFIILLHYFNTNGWFTEVILPLVKHFTSNTQITNLLQNT